MTTTTMLFQKYDWIRSSAFLPALIVFTLLSLPSCIQAGDNESACAPNESSSVDSTLAGQDDTIEPRDPNQDEFSSPSSSNNTRSSLEKNYTLIPSRPSSSSSLTNEAQILGAGSLYRVPDRSRGNEVQKVWSSVGVNSSLLVIKPTRADSISVIPTQPDIEGVTLPAAPVDKRRVCGETYWEMGNLPLQRSPYSNVNPDSKNPFDVVLVQPPVTYFEHTTTVGRLASATLDSTFHPSTLAFAVDITGDGVADLARTRYCCHNRSVHPDSSVVDTMNDDCYRCSTTFHRNSRGEWQRTYQGGPC